MNVVDGRLPNENPATSLTHPVTRKNGARRGARLKGCYETPVAATRLRYLSHLPRRLHAGLTPKSPLRGSYIAIRSVYPTVEIVTGVS